MTSTHKTIAFLKRRVAVTDEEALVFSEAFEEKVLRKNQILVQPGFTAKYKYYVLDGALRSFVVTALGQEVTYELAVDDWWITDYNSFIYQQPATLFVEAATNSTVLQLNFEKEQWLKQSNPRFETFFRIIAERGLASHQRRLICNLTLSAEERYTQFLHDLPQFADAFPQYVLASYLGMTTEFLSKIRNKKVKKKS